MQHHLHGFMAWWTTSALTYTRMNPTGRDITGSAVPSLTHVVRPTREVALGTSQQHPPLVSRRDLDNAQRGKAGTDAEEVIK